VNFIHTNPLPASVLACGDTLRKHTRATLENRHFPIPVCFHS
jgi:hypothetical protein